MNNIIGLIGGSGVGNLFDSHLQDIQHLDIETPFGMPSSPITVGKIGSKRIAFINRHGNKHKFSPSNIPYAANIFALKKLGVRSIIATGAVGSLQENIHPGQLVLIDQFIDKTYKRKTSFFDDFGAVHIEMAQPCCNRLRQAIFQISKDTHITTHNGGTYVCMEGPQFSTKAESLMHRLWGGDVIGMTAMPESKLAREAQVCYCLIAMPSDYDCWKPSQDQNKETLLKEIISNLKHCTENLLQLILKIIQESTDLILPECQCRKSLEFAVWTEKSIIEQEKMENLSVLFD
jgi:5'-methylthioadenosine phosphorylase